MGKQMTLPPEMQSIFDNCGLGFDVQKLTSHQYQATIHGRLSSGLQFEEPLMFANANGDGIRFALSTFINGFSAEKKAALLFGEHYGEKTQAGTIGKEVSVWDIQSDLKLVKDAAREAYAEFSKGVYDKDGNSMYFDGEPLGMEFVIAKDGFPGHSVAILQNGKAMFGGTKTKEDYLNEGYKVVSEQEFDKLQDDFCNSMCGEWQEVTEERYNEMLNILPPMRYQNGGFFISEATYMDVHSYLQEFDGKFYESMQRTSTPRTDILESLKSFIDESKTKTAVKEQ